MAKCENCQRTLSFFEERFTYFTDDKESKPLLCSKCHEEYELMHKDDAKKSSKTETENDEEDNTDDYDDAEYEYDNNQNTNGGNSMNEASICPKCGGRINCPTLFGMKCSQKDHYDCDCHHWFKPEKTNKQKYEERIVETVLKKKGLIK